MGDANVRLDNRIFALQKTNSLTEDLRLLLFHADVAYQQDREDVAEYLISEIERECRERNIDIFDINSVYPVDRR